MRRERILSVALAAMLVVVGLCPQVRAAPPDPAWTARYDGPAAEYDFAHGMAMDALGNVYVTGDSEGVGTDRDYATIQYDPDGNELWVARYDGPASSTDLGITLIPDGLGNVVVTGYSAGDGTGYDFLTVKYDGDGNELWTARHDTDGYQDLPSSIALDPYGNILVAGYNLNIDIGNDPPWTTRWYYRYQTVKYDPDGNELWAVLEPVSESPYGIAALAVDPDGNVLVTGGQEEDWHTIQYDPDGNKLWEAVYDGPAGLGESSEDLAVDDQGNVYVTGDCRLDTTNWDVVTIKYDPYGEVLWVAQYDGPEGLRDEAAALALDGEGNVVVTGSSDSATTDTDSLTLKYDADGNELWVARFDGGGAMSDRGDFLALDSAGNVFVGARSTVSEAASIDYATIKYDPDGNELWVARYNGPNGGADTPSGLAVDASGSAVVTGTSRFDQDPYAYTDFVTIKYNPAGSPPGWIASTVVPVESGTGVERAVGFNWLLLLLAAAGSLAFLSRQQRGR